jgi:siroheme synthase-like protein
MSYYPAMLNISGRRCVVVGGGKVAWRKAQALRDGGGRVIVISPRLGPELAKLAEDGRIEIIKRDYQEGDLEGAFMAVAATDDASVNQSVSREAREKGVLVNVADGPAASDFIVPSAGRVGDITLAVATGGQSPALARRIRLKLEEALGAEYATLLEMVAEVRREMQQRGKEIANDRWEAALEMDELLKLIKKGETEKARQALMEKLDAD